jgi:prepilin-type N-terminal cleavage/methylation domain-containing protein
MSSVSSGRAARGFSLVELAVVMLVMGLLLGGIVVPLNVQLESRNYEQTQRILDQAREALIGYAVANGRFPCPAAVNTTGDEAFHAVGTKTNGICSGAVSGAYMGFLPAATLGFTPVDAQGYAVDAWGFTQNRIRYAVSSWSANTLTKNGGMRAAGMSSMASAAMLYVCNSGAGATSTCGTGAGVVTLTSNAPVAIWSVGANAATGTGTDEAENLDADRVFVSRIRAAAEEAGGASGQFDDIVTWLGTSTLFSRLIAAGQLP